MSFWSIIIVVNCSLMVCEFMYPLSAIAVGIVIFNPPRWAGRESNSLSSLEHMVHILLVLG